MDLWDQAIAEMGTLEGFPNPPAMSSARQSRAPLDATEMGTRDATEGDQRQGFLVDRYLGTIPVTAKLPWDHIDIALEPDFLVKEYRKALKDRLSPPCGKPFKQLLHPSSVAAADQA